MYIQMVEDCILGHMKYNSVETVFTFNIRENLMKRITQFFQGELNF
jgi:hypothetical protein